MNDQLIADMLDEFGTMIRRFDRKAGEEIRRVATLLPYLRHALPEVAACPYCRVTVSETIAKPYHQAGLPAVVAFPMRVIQRLKCPDADEYRAGYRALWRCDNCGEMEWR